MTGSELLRKQGSILPGLSGKAANELARTQKRVEDETKRVRRKVGLTTQQPKLLEPVKPDPLPTPVETGAINKTKLNGRQSTILAGRMNRQRNIFNFNSTGSSILR